MADPNEVSQLIVEVASGTGPEQISQLIAEILAEAGGGPAQDSQLIAQVLATTGPDQISQLTIELLVGTTVVPPTDSPNTTEVFDEGEGGEWWLVPVLSDSGEELRDKNLKAIFITGKVTRCTLGVFGFGPEEEIDMDVIEGGNVFSRTNVIPIPDTTGVVRCARKPVNVKNAMVHTCRVEGIWDGVGMRDQIHEIVYEVAVQGARR